MGIAAYNRGTAAIRRDIDRTQRPALFALLDSLTEYSRRHATAEFLSPTVVRLDERGHAWLMNRKDRGWAEYGVCYKSVWALARHWKLIFVSIGNDTHSRYYEVIPAGAA